MPVTDEVTLVSAVRLTPVRMAVFAIGPILLAVAQLLNSVLAGLPAAISLTFAAVMLCYAALYTRYHLAQLRLRSLDPSTA